MSKPVFEAHFRQEDTTGDGTYDNLSCELRDGENVLATFSAAACSNQSIVRSVALSAREHGGSLMSSIELLRQIGIVEAENAVLVWIAWSKELEPCEVFEVAGHDMVDLGTPVSTLDAPPMETTHGL